MSEASQDNNNTLTIVLAADPPGLDPVQLQGSQNWAEAVAVTCVFDTLFYLDTSNNLQPKIGKSLRSTDGGKGWILEIQSGVLFSDGTTLDSDAVRFNWHRLADPENRAPTNAHAALIERMDVLDPVTLQVTLKSSIPHWDRQVARYLSTIGSPEAISAKGEGYAMAPVGAGPFILVEWERGDHMTFVRNPRYWQTGKPHLNKVIVVSRITDAAPKFEALNNGQAQVALEPLGGNLAKYRQQPDRFTLHSTPERGGGVALAMNVGKPPFDDVRVRRALALTLGSNEFVDQAGYSDPDMVMTTIDRADTPFHHPDIRLPKKDLETAQRLIDEVVTATGSPVHFVLETFANEGHLKEAHAIKNILESQLKNVDVEVAVGSVPEVAGKWRRSEYQATNYAVKWSDPVLDLPANFSSNSPLNIMHYTNEKLDADLDQLRGTTDTQTAVVLHQKVIAQILEDLPLIWLSHKEAYLVTDKSVRDFKLYYSLRPFTEDIRRDAP